MKFIAMIATVMHIFFSEMIHFEWVRTIAAEIIIQHRSKLNFASLNIAYINKIY